MLRQWLSTKTKQHAIILRWLEQITQWLKSDRKLPVQLQHSTEYTLWQQQFLQDRLRLWGIIVLLTYTLGAALEYHEAFLNAEQFDAELLREYGHAITGDRLRFAMLACLPIVIPVTLLGLIVRTSRWGRRHPALLFLGFSLSLNMPNLVIGSVYGFPMHPHWTGIFMAQAIFIPTCWQLHALSQAIPILYYLVGYPLLGLAEVNGSSIYNPHLLEELAVTCLLCNVGLFAYERIQRRELESRQQLERVLHSVSHDLKVPILGTSMYFNGLLGDDNLTITLPREAIQRLSEGCDRQLNLISSLQDAHQSDHLLLHCTSLYLPPIVASVSTDLQPFLTQRQVQLRNTVADNLPLVHADPGQLWRVFNNLITNAIKHNPSGICITIGAEVLIRSGRAPTLRCTIHDNGIGIPQEQCQHLFERYTRGRQARLTPGLGLGLYICRQIIHAHNGQIGIFSQPGNGTTVWFTLPLYQP